ncbi:hypothetical protein C1645_838979 [Glomus cerebriforme]|uniref:Uncharacterized protein n=1 Tax=Glomus cerebriforme TaxID=658196 RepID=A0A397SC27_9GLOM|nr:hypothetical protein C1645_838979 [Glomus cerebriforme]
MQKTWVQDQFTLTQAERSWYISADLLFGKQSTQFLEECLVVLDNYLSFLPGDLSVFEENLNELLENPNDIKRTTNKREKTSWVWRLIYELDPKFDMPNSKSVKAMIHITYNYTFKALTDLLEPITSVSLTLDLYPHTSENIKDSIEEIVGKWNLRSKVYSIITNNERIDASKKINSKDKMINKFFFQAEKLEDVQKSLNKGNDNEWNSSYYAWQRLLLLQDVIIILNTRLAFDVLELFAEVTDYLGGSSYCTYIADSLEETNNEDVFNEKESSQHQINIPINISELLDKVKEKLYESFLKDVSVYTQLQIKELLHDKVEELKLEGHSDIFTKFQKSGPKTVDDKVQEFLKLDEIDWEENPFIWWSHNKKILINKLLASCSLKLSRKMKPLILKTHGAIVYSHNCRQSSRTIAKWLGCEKTTVNNILKCLHKTHSLTPKKQTGCSPLLNSQAQQELKAFVQENGKNRRLCLKKLATGAKKWRRVLFSDESTFTQFQQGYQERDNVPPHHSKVAVSARENAKIKTLGWPAQILEKYLKEAWEDIPSEYYKKLVESMFQRIEAIIDTNGHSISY